MSVEQAKALVKQGVAAYKAGHHDQARDLFMQATEVDRHNVKAWLWLSGLLDDPEDKRICFENVLAIDPGNSAAEKGLAKLEVDQGPPPDDGYRVPSSAVQADPTPPAPSDAPPTTTSSASSGYVPPEPTAEVFDDMIGNLFGGAPVPKEEPINTDNPITEQVFADAFSGEFSDDDAFSDPFGTGGEDDLFSSIASSGSGSSSSSPFTEDLEALTFGIDDEDDDSFGGPSVDTNFDDFSSGPFSMEDSPKGIEAAQEDDPFAGVPDDDAAFAMGGGGVFATGPSSPVPGSMDAGSSDPMHALLTAIPDSIKATRMPGINERPSVLLLLVILLFVANLGAAAWAVIQLTG